MMASMQFLAKLLGSIILIVTATQIGRRFPTVGGLIATMPLTGLIVLLWLYSDNRQDTKLLTRFTQGALWGIGPSILFFLVAYIAFRRGVPFPLLLLMSAAAWVAGAALHQWLLR